MKKEELKNLLSTRFFQSNSDEDQQYITDLLDHIKKLSQVLESEILLKEDFVNWLDKKQKEIKDKITPATISFKSYVGFSGAIAAMEGILEKINYIKPLNNEQTKEKEDETCN